MMAMMQKMMNITTAITPENKKRKDKKSENQTKMLSYLKNALTLHRNYLI